MVRLAVAWNGSTNCWGRNKSNWIACRSTIRISYRYDHLATVAYFRCCREHRHFGRAAQACAVTQPALSMQIRELETRTGRRTGRAPARRRDASPKSALEVARRAEQVLAATRDLVDFARHRGRLLTGRLRLGVIPSLAPYVLPQILPRAAAPLSGAARRTARDPDPGADRRTAPRRRSTSSCWRCRSTAPRSRRCGCSTIRFCWRCRRPTAAPTASAWQRDDIDQQRLILLEEGHCLRDQALAYCSSARGDVPASARRASRR